MSQLFRMSLIQCIFLAYSHVSIAAAAAAVEKTLLQLSYGKNQEEMLLLLNKKVDLDEKDFFGRTALHLNAMNNNFAVIEKLIEKKASINSRDVFSHTPLMWAARNGHQISAEILIKAGADYELQNYKKRTALNLAAIHGHYAIVKMIEAKKK